MQITNRGLLEATQSNPLTINPADGASAAINSGILQAISGARRGWRYAICCGKHTTVGKPRSRPG